MVLNRDAIFRYKCAGNTLNRLAINCAEFDRGGKKVVHESIQKPVQLSHTAARGGKHKRSKCI